MGGGDTDCGEGALSLTGGLAAMNRLRDWWLAVHT